MHSLSPGIGRTGRWFSVAAVVAIAIVGTIVAYSRSPVAEKAGVAYAALPHAALAIIAEVEGLYLQKGLEVSSRIFPYGKAALEEVLQGRADFATVAETPIMFAIMGGADIVIIATIQTSQCNEAIIARGDGGIRRPEDLKGKRIGVTLGTTSEFFMDSFLTAHGVSRASVTAVDLEPSAMADALARGEVDAASAFVPHLVKAQQILGAGGMTFYDEEVYTETFNVVATRDLVRRNPVRVRKMLRALLLAEEYARRSPRQAQEAVAAFIKEDRDIVSRIWPGNRFEVRLDQSLVLALEDEAQWAMDAGLAPRRTLPNFLDFIHVDGLAAVKPAAVRILK